MSPKHHRERLRTLRETPDIRIACSSSLGRVCPTAPLLPQTHRASCPGLPLLQQDRRADRRTA